MRAGVVLPAVEADNEGASAEAPAEGADTGAADGSPEAVEGEAEAKAE